MNWATERSEGARKNEESLGQLSADDVPTETTTSTPRLDVLNTATKSRLREEDWAAWLAPSATIRRVCVALYSNKTAQDTVTIDFSISNFNISAERLGDPDPGTKDIEVLVNCRVSDHSLSST